MVDGPASVVIGGIVLLCVIEAALLTMSEADWAKIYSAAPATAMQVEVVGRHSPSSVAGLSAAETAQIASGMTVAEVMSADPLTVNSETTIEEAAVLMRGHKIGGLPVLEH